MDRSISEITQLWDKALIKIEEKIGEKQVFDYFFANTYIEEINNNEIIVATSTNLGAQLIATKYNDLVSEVIYELTETNYRLKYILPSEAKTKSVSISNTETKPSYFKDANIKTNLTFDNFVVGDFNREASQAALFVASNPGKTFAQPLFIYSNSGLGKTHLLQAIGNYIAKEGKAGSKILYISANDFVEEYIRFVHGEKESESMKDFFNTIDVLLIDDVQLLAKKDKTQEMFFTIYNKLIDNNKQIVITSDKQPSELRGLEDRLVTRFSKGLTVKINEPDSLTLVEILKKKITANGLDISIFDESVFYLMAEKFSKDIRELEGALNRLMFYIINNKQTDRVTVEVAIDAIEPLIGGKSLSTQLNEQKIINVVADYYNLTPSQLTGKIRTGQIALARHIAMYLIRIKLDVPLKKIGEMFGGKDHTTVMSGISKVDKGLKTDPMLKEAVEELQKRLNV